MLESALARPLNLAVYRTPDIAELAAMYALAITQNHPFVDGNKRTGYVALETFLALNGCEFPISDAEVVVVMRSVAAGTMTESEFTSWVRDSMRPL